MRRICQSLFFVTLILAGCTLPVASPTPPPPPTTEAPPVFPTTAVPPETQNCGYQWAHGDLPELSSSFQAAIQDLEPLAQASAYAFGENCVLPDGSIGRFLPMETDFNVMLPVDDLANEAVLGRWIVRIMEVIERIPADEITGPRPGKVSVVFESSTAQRVINFYIDQYGALPAGLSHEDVYHALQSQQ
jgi:hypothetical protein